MFHGAEDDPGYKPPRWCLVGTFLSSSHLRTWLHTVCLLCPVLGVTSYKVSIAYLSQHCQSPTLIYSNVSLPNYCSQGRRVHIGELGSRLGRQHSQGGKKDIYFSLSFGHSFGIIALISTSYHLWDYKFIK